MLPTVSPSSSVRLMNELEELLLRHDSSQDKTEGTLTMDDRQDARQLISGMGWEPLPYGCVGLIRSAPVGRSERVAWTWLILVPWAMNDAKPWIDGTKIISNPLLTNDQQRDQIRAEMRDLLDKRYGETVAGRAADEFLEGFQKEN